jgi:hypothetical protein
MTSHKSKITKKRWWDDDGDGIGYESGEVSGKFKGKKVKEAKEIKKWWDDDGDGIGWEKGEVSKKFDKKKVKVTKEGFSNWRQELLEIKDEIDAKDEKQIKEKKVKNSITINPKLEESLGGIIIEANEIVSFDDIFSELNEHEIAYLNDKFIESIVEEVFYECLEEGYELNEIGDILIETIELNTDVLNEEKVTYGHDTEVKSDRLGKVKSAVKKVGKALARGAGYAAGLAARGAKAAGREFGAGYSRGRKGSSGQSSSSDSYSSDSSSSQKSRPGILSRIGSKLKRGLKKAIASGARSVSRGARNVARRMETDSNKDKIVTPDTKSHPVHAKSGTRSPSPRSGIGGGKKVEVTGTAGKTAPIQPKKKSEPISDPWEGSYTTPRPKPKVKQKTTTVKSGTSQRGRELRQKADEILASLRKENYNISEDETQIGTQTTSKEMQLKQQLAKKMREKSDIEGKLSRENLNQIRQQKEDYEISEREMTSADKAKESKLKSKFDDSEMKQNMIDQYGKEKGTQIYFAKIRKMAMSESDEIEMRSKSITDPISSSSGTSRKPNLKMFYTPPTKKKKKKKNPVTESFRALLDDLDEAKLSRTEKREKSANKPKRRSKTMHLVDLDANAMKPKKKGVEAEIEVKKSGKTVKSLNPQQFNTYKFKDDEKPDFNQFRSSKVFKKTLKGNKKVRNLHRGGEASGLTARGGMDKNREVVSHVRSSGFSKKHGVNLKGVHFTGDVPGKGTDDKKMKVIKNLIKAKKPKTIKFSDDHAKNLEAPERFNKEGGKDKNKNRGSSTPKIKTYLTRDDGRPVRFGSGGGGVRNPSAVNKSSSPQETQKRRQIARRGMVSSSYEIGGDLIS